MIISQQNRGMHEEGKGGRSYIKTLYKIIRIFNDDKNSFEEIISRYNVLFINRISRRRNYILT